MEVLTADLRAHQAAVLAIDTVDGAIVDANEAAVRFYGWERGELLGRTAFDINVMSREQVRAALDGLSGGAVPSGLVVCGHRVADGSRRDVEVECSLLAHGGREWLCAIVHDVTHRRGEQERSTLASCGLQGVLAGADELLGLPLDDLLRRAVAIGRERLGLERCTLYLADREADVMRGTFALSRAGRTVDQTHEAHPDVAAWLALAAPHLGQRWAVSHGPQHEDGTRAALVRPDGWTAITLIRSSHGVVGTFHNDCAWSGEPLDAARQELVDVYCSLLGSIIERKRVEETLQDSERSLRLLAENATDLVGRVSTEGRILYLSPSCRAVMGWEPAELLGRSVFEFIHLEDADGSKYLRRPKPGPDAQPPKEQGTPQEQQSGHGTEPGADEIARRELRALNASGEWVWLEVVSRLVSLGNGFGAGPGAEPGVEPGAESGNEVQFSARDISARRRAEEALRVSEERFRLFMDNSPAMSFIKDAQGRYLYLNQTSQRIYNAPLEKMLGLTNFDRLPLDVALRLRANDLQVLGSNQPQEFLEVVPDPSGRERSWLTFKFPLPDGAGGLAVGGVAIDITERREFEAALSRSELRLSTVVNSAPLVLWTLDRDGFYTTSEGQGLHAMGLRPGQMVGRSAFEMYAGSPEILASVGRVLGGEEFNGDLAVGDLVLQCSHKPTFNAQGEVTGSLGVAFDITERRRAEQALDLTVRRLENLLEIDHAIRSARSPSDIAAAALSLLCAQIRCRHAAVTVFNFDSGEATVLASCHTPPPHTEQPTEQPTEQEARAQDEAADTLHQAPPISPTSRRLTTGERYPLSEIVAALAPLVMHGPDATPTPSERESPDGLLPAPLPARLGPEAPDVASAQHPDEPLGERPPVFWQRHPAQSTEGASEFSEGERRRSLPLIAGGDLVGALDVEAAEEPLSEEMWVVAREVAGPLAIAIQQARLFEQVRAGKRSLQALSHRLIETQEAERRHLARELHDEIGQVLTAVKLNLQGASLLADRWIGRATECPPLGPGSGSGLASVASSTWGQPGAAASLERDAQGLKVRLDESMEVVEQALGQVRNLSLNLRPSLLDDLGLGPAMRWLVDRLASRLTVEVRLEIRLAPGRLPPDIETACFRVAQEALTNATRHAQASHIDIVLSQGPGHVDLVIRDDGQGFDPSSAHARAAGGSSLGLPGMEERAVLVGGHLSIESAPGRGTLLSATFPLHEWPADEPKAPIP